MGHKRDWFNEKVRRVIWPLLDGLFQFLGITETQRQIRDRELAAIIPYPVEAVEYDLHQMGFHRNHWAKVKYRESGQWADGSWVWWPDGMTSDMQLHIHLFKGQTKSAGEDPDGPEWTWAYAHWEDNYWTHPQDHLDGTNFSSEDGVERFRTMLEEAGIPYFTGNLE